MEEVLGGTSTTLGRSRNVVPSRSYGLPWGCTVKKNRASCKEIEEALILKKRP